MRRRLRVRVQPQAFDATRDVVPAIPAIADRDARVWTFLRGVLRPSAAMHPTRPDEPVTRLQVQIVDELQRALVTGMITVERACQGKVRYRTPTYAERMAREMTKLYGRPQVMYPCPFCTGYHLSVRPHPRPESR